MSPEGEPATWGQSWEEEGDAEGLTLCALLEPLEEKLVSASPGASSSTCPRVCPEVSQKDQGSTATGKVWGRQGAASRIWEPLGTPVRGTVTGCPPTAPSRGQGARSQWNRLYQGHRRSPGPPRSSYLHLFILSASSSGREGRGGR